MRVLISGFMPFGSHSLNPTALLIEALEKNEIPYPDALTVDQLLLPVTFRESFDVLQARINQFNPDVVIAFGLAAGRDAVNLENLAVNKLDAEISDNNGEQPQGLLINPQGPESYLSTLPLQGLEGALKDEGIPVQISQSAGTYVCNYLFYRLMETNTDTLRLCGFIHVPLLPEQAGSDKPSMTFTELKKTLSVILNYIDY